MCMRVPRQVTDNGEAASEKSSANIAEMEQSRRTNTGLYKPCPHQVNEKELAPEVENSVIYDSFPCWPFY